MRTLAPMLLTALLLAACGPKEPPTGDAGTDAGTPDTGDAGGAPDGGTDADTGGGGDADMGTAMLGDPVPVDVESLTSDAPDPSDTARVFQSTDRSDLIDGTIVGTKVGDWVMENGQIRVVVEDDDRVMSPCPFGGTLLAGDRVGDDAGGSIFAQACLFINAGQTVVPSKFEVVQAGGLVVRAVGVHVGEVERRFPKQP